MPGLPFLVDDFAPGREYSVDLLVGKHIGPQPHFVETGHNFPARVCAV